MTVRDANPASFNRLGGSRRELEGQLRRRRATLLIRTGLIVLLSVIVASFFPRLTTVVAASALCIFFGWLAWGSHLHRRAEDAGEAHIASLPCPVCSHPFGDKVAHAARTGEFLRRSWEQQRREGFIVDMFGNWAVACDRCVSEFLYHPHTHKIIHRSNQPCTAPSPESPNSSLQPAMSRLGKSIVVVAVIWCVGFTIFASHRTGFSQLLTLPLIPCFLVAVILSIVCVFSEWRKRRWRSLLPFGACVLSVVVSDAIVRPIRHAIFVQSLPSYEAVVQQMESGRIPLPATLSRIPQAESQARLVYAVLAEKDTKGVLTVEFLTERGFPVEHSGHLYCSSGVIEPGSTADSRWPIRHEERPKWFYISD